MKTSPRGIEDLVLSEGLRLKAYRDSVGVWTIGVGHAATAGTPPIPKAGMMITRQEAFDILARDLAQREAVVSQLLGPAPQHVFDGAMSFHFNTGAIRKATWVDAYKRGDMKDAERRFMLYNKPPEIVGRRQREADLIFRGKYRSPPKNDPLPPPAPANPILRKGDGIASAAGFVAVREAQVLLKAAGFDPGPADGKFGIVTEAKVIAFQRQRGLMPDGVIGPKTWAALRSPNPAVAVMGNGDNPVPHPMEPDFPDEPQPKETTMMDMISGRKTYIALGLGGVVVVLNAIGISIPGVDLDPNGWFQQVIMLLTAGGFRSAMKKS